MVAPNAGILSLFLFDVILVSVPLAVPSTLLKERRPCPSSSLTADIATLFSLSQKNYVITF
jgi:prephenate dehydrogenase